MNRRLCSVVLIALAVGCGKRESASVDPAAAVANCRRDAQASADAVARRDADAILAGMHPEALRATGQTADQMKATIAKGFAEMEREGVTFGPVALDGPAETFAGRGERRFGIVHQTLNIRVAGKGRITSRSYLLGVSDDAGATWRFVDGAGLGKVDVTKVLADYPAAEHPLPTVAPPSVERE